MSDLYAGEATFSLPTGETVLAKVDLWINEVGPLIEWGGTAEAYEPHILWKDGQQVSAIRIGDVHTGYRVSECMIISLEPDPDVERVTLRGSGEFEEVAV
jgi:hypothetical protein